MVNDRWFRVDQLPAETTLLAFLRQQAFYGTKEGCASGDCSACSVIIGRETQTGMDYQAVNACLCPLGSLDKARVITVEGLARACELELHPVQQAMLDCHASQCGFCTPGFVMALAALHNAQQGKTISREQLIEAISGNLCRCTGYKPIVDAGLQSLTQPAQIAKAVQAWEPDAPAVSSQHGHSEKLHQNPGHYWQPASETELQSLMREYPQAQLIAGGTDLMLLATQAYQPLAQLIDLNAIASLQQCTADTDYLTLGSACTYSDLQQQLQSLAPEFVLLLKRLGSRQIRNRGTLGGNIANASPIADCPPWLLVLGAQLQLTNSHGQSRWLPLQDFYLGYKQTALQADEYIAQIRIALNQLNSPQKIYKISKRFEDDISAVLGAFSFADGKLAIAFGGMAATPKRASATETFLNAQPWLKTTGVDQAILARACDILRSEFAPLSDVRASSDYRLAMACALLHKACEAFACEQLGLPQPEELFSEKGDSGEKGGEANYA